MTTSKETEIKVKIEPYDEERRDPTSYLPEEPMTYEIKKKKKKKKKKQEDPFKDIEEKVYVTERIVLPDPVESIMDPEVNIKVEDVEVQLDFNDFAHSVFDEAPPTEDSQEPVVPIDQQNHDAVLLTFEDVNGDTVLDIPKPKKPPPTCKICHLVFQSTKTLRVHQKRKHKVFRRSLIHNCEHCDMSYDQKNSLAAHIKRKHGPNAIPEDNEERTCELCALVFKGMDRLRMHMRRKHGSFEDTFKHVCKECGLTYDKYRSLIVHIKRKHSEKKKPVLNQWYNCIFCPKFFNKRETYARHIQRTHQVPNEGNEEEIIRNEAGEIICKECPLVFSSVSYLKLHMRRKHNALRENFRLKCSLCNLSYDKIESLKRHVRRKHDQQTYCKVCDKQFDTREMYISHSHVKSVKECSMCGQIFASQGGLAKHLRFTHKLDSPKVVFCHICNEGFHDKRMLKPHLLKVHLKVSYPCSLCKKVFKAKESYRRHILFKHPEQGDIKKTLERCDQCSETFPDEFELCKHINLAHPSVSDNKPELSEIKKEELENQAFQCTKCPESYISWDDLRLHHEQNHVVSINTQCQICGQIVEQKEIQKHIKHTHTINVEVQCRFCDYKTNNKASMTQHMLRHKNAHSLNCEFPGCRYKTYYELAMQKHRQKHRDQGVKLQCSQCPFQSMNKYVLKYHEEAHTSGKKKYKCSQCDYATTLPANLVQHKYKHSTEKRFKCEVCPFATKYNTSLRFHVKKKHCDLPMTTVS